VYKLVCEVKIKIFIIIFAISQDKIPAYKFVLELSVIVITVP